AAAMAVLNPASSWRRLSRAKACRCWRVLMAGTAGPFQNRIFPGLLKSFQIRLARTNSNRIPEPAALLVHETKARYKSTLAENRERPWQRVKHMGMRW